MDVDASQQLETLFALINKVSLSVVKNTLLRKAMDKVEGKDFSELYDLLTGPTALMISDTGNAPAKLIKDFRKKSDKPIIKGPSLKKQSTLAVISWNPCQS
ncbi:50S ribosomal protein L10 [Cryomorphaceae bacterium]|nr:50S ribosomal protein L10 [Cryomorphaceae bacterium]